MRLDRDDESAESLSPHIELIHATQEQQQVLSNLLELYVYDFSELLSLDTQEDGRFGYKHLPLYWSEAGRHPFLVRVDGKLAGLVLVKRGPGVSRDEVVWDIAEFFVLRRYRRHGVGMRVAHEVWRRFPGAWEVRVREGNEPAQRFWVRAVESFNGQAALSARVEDDGDWWQVFSFESRPVV